MRNPKAEYILLGLLIALAGFEILFRAGIVIRFGIAVFILYIFLKERKKLNPDFFLIMLLFITPLIYQIIEFNLPILGFKNIVNLIINLFIGYLVLELIKDRLHITFVNFVYFLAIFSLLFYPTQFFPSLQDFIKDSIGSILTPIGTEDYPEGFKSKSLIFFTYMHNYGNTLEDTFPRNCGAFWEPSLFAVFLNLALLINLYINHSKLFAKKNVVFMIAIITTLSTAGYISLFLIIISKFFYHSNKVRIFISLPVVIIYIYISYAYVWKMDFISEKISHNIEERTLHRSSRFGAALYHFNHLKQYPLAGVYLKAEADEQYMTVNERTSTPNGLSSIFFLFGIPAGILYFILLFKGINKWLLFNNINDKQLTVFFFIIFMLLAFSQDVTTRLFYLMMLFLVICIPKYDYKTEE